MNRPASRDLSRATSSSALALRAAVEARSGDLDEARTTWALVRTAGTDANLRDLVERMDALVAGQPVPDAPDERAPLAIHAVHRCHARLHGNSVL